MKIKKLKLKNGLKVLLVESRKSPVVSVQMWVRTGSADEKKGEEGVSHFIEHLLFKGTRKFKTGEIAALVEGNGGELN
ncbi:MAG: insulinase family protein, partial [Bdellovibrionales bacterium]